MSENQRTQLRTIMTVAWALFREGDRSFSEALRGGWKFVRGCQKLRPTRRSRGAVRSITVERLGRGAYVGGRQSAAYLSSRLGF